MIAYERRLLQWDQAFPNNRPLASATVDRLRHNAYCIELAGQLTRMSLLFRDFQRKSGPPLPHIRDSPYWPSDAHRDRGMTAPDAPAHSAETVTSSLLLS